MSSDENVSKGTAEPVASDEARMSFVEHLAELRLRLRNSAIVFLIAIGFSFYFVKNYFDLLTRPARAVSRACPRAGH